MPAYKDAQKGTWYATFYYQDWKGVKKKKLKRGFPTKKEALAWERTFLLQQAADLTMTFEAFVEIYIVDKQNRLRENTWSTKEHIIRTKILPYFKEKRLCDIKPQDGYGGAVCAVYYNGTAGTERSHRPQQQKGISHGTVYCRRRWRTRSQLLFPAKWGRRDSCGLWSDGG